MYTKEDDKNINICKIHHKRKEIVKKLRKLLNVGITLFVISGIITTGLATEQGIKKDDIKKDEQKRGMTKEEKSAGKEQKRGNRDGLLQREGIINNTENNIINNTENNIINNTENNIINNTENNIINNTENNIINNTENNIINNTENNIINNRESIEGRIFYVAKNGNDNNPGTELKPWLTLKKAANTLIAGDTVYIKSGTYRERLIPKNSGNVGSYITYMAYPGNSVTIDGTDIYIPMRNGMVMIQGKSYINIKNLRITNSKWAGIYVVSSRHINLNNNYIYNTVSSGIQMSFGNNYVIDGNEINMGNVGSTEQEIISVQATNIFEIKNNYVHDGKKIGIDAKNGASNGKIHHNRVYKTTTIGIYVDAWDKTQGNIEVYSNSVYKTGTGIAVAAETGGTVNNVSIHNNLVYDVLEIGIRIPMVTHTGYAHLNNIKIFNNVAYHNGYNSAWRNGGIRIGQSGNTYINNLIVRNNILSQNDYYQIKYIPSAKYTNIVIDRNLIDGYRRTAYEVRGTNYIEGGPQFVDSISRNFRLRSTSPAIDKGYSSGAPRVDFEGILRPRGAGYDIGPYEYTAGNT